MNFVGKIAPELLNITNSTILANDDAVPSYLGYISLVVCIFCFGSNLLPVKKYDTGDGMFFELTMAVSIWSVALIVHWARNFPKFYALPMLGGFLWSTSNINTVPIIRTLGIGMGLLIRGTTSIVVGWADARFGIFGTKNENPSNIVLNYFSILFIAISAIFFLFVKPESSEEDIINERKPLLATEQITANQDVVNMNSSHYDENDAFFEHWNPKAKRIFGSILAVVAGTFFATTYVPYLYVMDNYDGASHNGLDYVLSISTGILSGSLIYFTIYCIIKKNHPFINPKAALPGLISGWMWGIGNCSFLLASSSLSQAITFPIIGSVPSVIASLYGIFIFKEIQGKRNVTIFICGFLLVAVGSILSGISR